MINRVKLINQCWWCNSISNSREHKYKRTDIIREFGKGPYKTGEINRNSSISDKDYVSFIQSPNSDFLKFGFNICHNCNSTKSQEFDLTYDVFISYFKLNEDFIYKEKFFDLYSIFGATWSDKKESLVKYFVKYFCCRLAEDGIEIKPDLIQFLNGNSFLKSLHIHLAIKSDKAHFSQMLKKDGLGGYISLDDLTGNYIEESDSFEYIFTSYDYRGLSIIFVYSGFFESFESNLINRYVLLDSLDNPDYNEFIKNKHRI